MRKQLALFVAIILLTTPVVALNIRPIKRANANTTDSAIQNGGFEEGLTGWSYFSNGFLNVTDLNAHSGTYSMEISSSISQQAYFYQFINFPNTSFTFSFWIFRADPNSDTSCYLSRDWDGNTAKTVCAFVIKPGMIALDAWDNPHAPGFQYFNYDVTAGVWHNITFAAYASSKTQNFYVDGNLIAVLNSSSGTVFNPDLLLFGDVTNEGSNGTFYFDDLALNASNDNGSPPPPVNQISILPFPVTTLPTTDFNVDINVQGITDLYSWELQFFYLNSVINCTGVTEENYLRTHGNTVWATSIQPNYNSTHGMIDFGASLVGAIPGVSGSGALASVSFDAVNPGNTSIDITNAIILDSNLHDINCTFTNGFVEVREPTTHDIAVLSVNPNKNLVGQGLTMNVTLTVQNQGDFAENFTVMAMANSSVIGAQDVQNLGLGDSLILSFTWDTAGVTRGDYMISGNATTVPNETDIADNTAISSTVVHVGVQGDVNGDHITNMRDIAALCRAFNLVPNSSTGYLVNYDLNNDGRINMRDIAIAILHFQETE